VYEFLLVRNSNLGRISHHFGDIAGFLPCRVTPPLATPILGVFPLHQMAHVGWPQSQGLRLFRCEIIFEEFQPMLSPYLNVTLRRTDRQTDRQHTISIPRYAHSALRGKKHRPSAYCLDLQSNKKIRLSKGPNWLSHFGP